MVKAQLQEFKKFILRGNVVDLAVAVVIGAAFNNIVTRLVTDFITPLIGAIRGGQASGSTAAGTTASAGTPPEQTFSTGIFHFRGQEFLYGDFINAVLSFLIIAAVVFFLVVQPLNKLMAISNRRKAPADPTTKKCPECLSEIPKAATRCAFCTSKQPADALASGRVKSAASRA